MTNNKYKGRPPIYAGRDPKLEILKLLPENGEEITFSEWQKRVFSRGISNSTFTKYRRQLELEDLVIRRVDSESEPPKAYYRINHEPFSVFPPEVKCVISDMKPLDAKEYFGEEKRKEYLEWIKWFLDLETRNISIHLLAFINHAQNLPEGANPYAYLETVLKLWILPLVKGTFSYLAETGEKYPEQITELIDYITKHFYGEPRNPK